MRRLVPIVLVLLTAAPQAALAGQWFRCRFTGVTRAACCCGESAHEARPPHQPELRSTFCCDVLRNEPRVESACAESRGELRVPVAQVAIVLAPLEMVHTARDRSSTPVARATAPPGRTQPLYVSLSSLLL